MRVLELVLSQLFDYAGMFPPANKSLEESLIIAAAFPRSLKRPHLINCDFVVSVNQLTQLETLMSKVVRPLSFAILGDDGTPKELARLNTFTHNLPPTSRVYSYEIKVSTIDKAQILVLRSALPQSITLCLEPTNSQDYTAIEAITKTIQTLFLPATTLKLRGAGATPITNNHLAKVIPLIARSEIALKMTAGLHHPIIEQERYGNELGFLNILVALLLCRAYPEIREQELLNLLYNNSSDTISLDKELRWKGYTLSYEQIREIRRNFPFSIGCCDIHEADNDLVRLYGECQQS